MFKPFSSRFGLKHFQFLAVFVLAFVVLVVALKAASAILIPIALAWLLGALLSPAVRYAQRYHIPPTLSALVLMGLVVYGMVLLFLLMIGPVEQWLQEIPRILRDFREKMADFSGPLSSLQAVTEEVRQLYVIGDNDRMTPVEVKVERESTLGTFLLANLPVLLAGTTIVVFLTYFFLASGDRFLRKSTQLGANLGSRRRIVRIAYRIRQDISRYLATITVINIGLGLCVALAMRLLGVPNALLWGLMATCFNFAPYVGAVVMVGLLTLVGIATFPNMAQALLVPGVYAMLSIAEGHMITPLVIGRRLAVTPTAVFLSVVVWGWLWGVAGALMAVPLLASFKIVCENVPQLMPISRLLDNSSPKRHRRFLRAR
ncbi:AI-2E family transporter [Marinimicrobium sp. ARAG 43.8]|uniref:AI-2E family transporter n=1 Tax=Marinimicrobium sp. ARAG 43.8 TaxID=3418719 RepID=UPI003CF7F798